MQRKELRGWMRGQMRDSLLSVVLPTKAVRSQFLFLSTINKMITFVSLLTRIHCLSQFLFLKKLVELGEGENR